MLLVRRRTNRMLPWFAAAALLGCLPDAMAQGQPASGVKTDQSHCAKLRSELTRLEEERRKLVDEAGAAPTAQPQAPKVRLLLEENRARIVNMRERTITDKC